MSAHCIDPSTDRTPLLHEVNTSVPPSDAQNVSSSNEVISGGTDEEATLGSKPPSSTKNLVSGSSSVLQIVLVLLIGVFISNADGSILMATHPIIASEFDALHDSSWLLTSFGLAASATQPLYGKLSDIYGRKSLLLLAYFLFAAGCTVVGVGTSMSLLIFGRVVSGLGASGMTALVSILITDLVPLREIASWRSYVKVVATTGRSIGGPLGGWLADTVGWRWSFAGQAPLAIVAMVFIVATLPNHSATTSSIEAKKGSLARIDFLGATFLTLTILCFLFPLEIGGDRLPWSHPLVLGLLSAACLFGVLFWFTEAKFANEPLIPVVLLRQKELVLSSFINICQSAAQVGVMVAVPLYFQVTSEASNTEAGAHLFPAVVGNAIGGILSGVLIKRNGRYKTLTLLSILAGSAGYLLLILRWHGNTNWLESLYIIPGGFAMGVVISTLFVSVQAAIDPSHSAVAATTLYLSGSVGMLIGMACCSSVLQGTLRSGLERRLSDAGFSSAETWMVIERAVSDVHYSSYAKPRVAGIVIGSYVEALAWTHGLSLFCSLAAFTGALLLKQHRV